VSILEHQYLFKKKNIAAPVQIAAYCMSQRGGGYRYYSSFTCSSMLKLLRTYTKTRKWRVSPRRKNELPKPSESETNLREIASIQSTEQQLAFCIFGVYTL
jgi:hypothetical protein